MFRLTSFFAKSLDDFCRRFFAGSQSDPLVKPYTFDDVVAALDAVTPYDWRTMLNTRVSNLAPEPPLNGVLNGGWKMGFSDQPSEYQKSTEEEFKSVDEMASLGLVVKTTTFAPNAAASFTPMCPSPPDRRHPPSGRL